MTQSSTEALLGERGNTHGDFRVQFAIAQKFKEVCQETDTWWEMDPVVREGIEMDLMKLSRILTGQWMFDDHWADRLGYTALSHKRVQELQKAIDMSWVDAAITGVAEYAEEMGLIENEPEND